MLSRPSRSKQPNPEFVSMSGLIRRLDVTYDTVRKAMESGVIKPDHTLPGGYFFKTDRIPEISAAIEAATTQRS